MRPATPPPPRPRPKSPVSSASAASGRQPHALDPPALARHRAAKRGTRPMRVWAGSALALLLLLGGCGGGPRALRCPQPVVYDDATLKQIQKAREALPKD